jgi:hypothetical protein
MDTNSDIDPDHSSSQHVMEKNLRLVTAVKNYFTYTAIPYSYCLFSAYIKLS